jgi:hypothetical protein
MNRRAMIVLICAASAIAQPKFNAPLAGIARDSRQQLRIVHAVSGTFILHDVIGGTVADWAFDGSGGLVKTDVELLTIGADGAIAGRRSATQRETVMGPQSAFFPETHELWQTGPNGVNKVSIEPAMIAGSVIALGAVRGNSVQLAVCRANALWLLSVDTSNGTLTRELAPGGAIGEQACLSAGGGSLVLLADRMLLASARAVLVQTAAGIERSIPISASHAARVGKQWVEVESPAGPAQMIRITSDGENAYQLPAAKELP